MIAKAAHDDSNPHTRGATETENHPASSRMVL